MSFRPLLPVHWTHTLSPHSSSIQNPPPPQTKHLHNAPITAAELSKLPISSCSAVVTSESNNYLIKFTRCAKGSKRIGLRRTMAVINGVGLWAVFECYGDAPVSDRRCCLSLADPAKATRNCCMYVHSAIELVLARKQGKARHDG